MTTFSFGNSSLPENFPAVFMSIQDSVRQNEVTMFSAMDQTTEGATAASVEEMLRGDASRFTLVQLTFEDEEDARDSLQQDNSEDVREKTNSRVNNVMTNKGDGEVDGCAAPRDSVVQRWLRGLGEPQTADTEGSNARVTFNVETISIEDDDAENVKEDGNTEIPTGGAESPARRTLASNKNIRKIAPKNDRNKRQDCPRRTRSGRGPTRDQCGPRRTRLPRAEAEARPVAVETHIVPSGERLPLETDSEWWEREKQHAYLRYRMTPPAARPRARNVAKVKVNEKLDNQTQPSGYSELSQVNREGEGEGEGEGEPGGRGQQAAGPPPGVPVVTYVPYVQYVPRVAYVQYGLDVTPPLPADSSPIIIID